jgi:hypothetical protein
MHCVLIALHYMIGLDIHIDLAVPTPPTPPSPVHPHLTGLILFGWGGIKAKWAKKELAWGIHIIHMGSDIGPGIPHIPLPPTHFLLSPMETVFSGSKSHFGPASVQTSQGPIGAALAVVVNPNLNCGCPCPTPTGLVIAPNTVLAHMTLGDVIGGFVAMYCDIVIATLLNVATGGNSWIQFFTGSPLGMSGGDVLFLIAPKERQETHGWMKYVPLFPGFVGAWGDLVSDAGRHAGYKVGDAISGAETPTDRLYGRDGAYAQQQVAPAVDQPVDTSGGSNPASGVTHNQGTEELN